MRYDITESSLMKLLYGLVGTGMLMSSLTSVMLLDSNLLLLINLSRERIRFGNVLIINSSASFLTRSLNSLTFKIIKNCN